MIRHLAATMALALGSHAFAAPPAVTLHGGIFTESLMLVADKERGMLSGYYREGRCRLFFHGPLQPVVLDLRSELGEAYTPRTVMLGHGEAAYGLAMYSRATGGYFDQITIEPPRESRRLGCQSRVSMDRTSDVSNAFIGVRVVRRSRAPLYQRERVDGEMRLVRDWKTVAPPRYAGVWIQEGYSAGDPPAGYLHIGWYIRGGGTPMGAYVQEADLFPLE